MADQLVNESGSPHWLPSPHVAREAHHAYTPTGAQPQLLADEPAAKAQRTNITGEATLPSGSSPKRPSIPSMAMEDVPSLPNELPVVCGSAQGILQLKGQAWVLFEGRKISMADFERAGGRNGNKKWRQSVKTLLPGGDVGPSMAIWLMKHSIDIRLGQVVRVEPGDRLSQAAPPASAAAAQGAKKPQSPRPGLAASQSAVDNGVIPRREVDALSRSWIDSAGMRDGGTQVQSVRYDGLLAGDNTPLPRNLPAASMDSPTAPSGGSFLDLNTMSYDELMAAAARSNTGSEPLGDLLSINPSMMRKRQAFVTGLEPLIGLRQKTGSGPLSDATAMVLPEEAAVMLAEYLEGHRNDAPWHALGVSKPIVIDGKPLELRRLYEAVTTAGGFAAVCSHKLWSQIRQELDFDDTSSSSRQRSQCTALRSHFQNLLSRHEQQQSALLLNSSGARAAAVIESSENMKDDSKAL